MSKIIINNIVSALDEFFHSAEYSNVGVLVDEHTKEFCLPIIESSLPKFSLIEIKSGEIHKNLDTCQSIWEKLTYEGFDRKSLMVNLGGGIIGDMGGFCAVTFKRGIHFINIPTTLLASVDASIGGKLGVDFQGFKNHLGFFQEPETVFIDPVFLNTLPERELRSGFAEVIKHGLIADSNYFHELIQNGINQPDWGAVIEHSVHIKEEVVKNDPKEAGLRKVLNFGHTVGHAIESYHLKTDHPLLHGEAIAIGMVCEAFLSTKLCGLTSEELDTITSTIVKIFEKVDIDKKSIPDIMEIMYQDKKNKNGLLNHSLIQRIGVATHDVVVDEKDVIDSLFYYLQLPA